MIQRVGIGRGYTQKEALEDWLTSDPLLQKEGLSYGKESLLTTEPIIVKELEQPHRARRVHTSSYPQRGQRKFITAFYVFDKAKRESVLFDIDLDKHLVTEDDLMAIYFKRQTDAIKASKALAHITYQSYDVIICKVIISGKETVATISPGKSRPGIYLFTAQFKY